MKVIHIVAGDLHGGAAKGAYNLHRALLAKGVDSVILTTGKNFSGDATVISTNRSKLSRIFGFLRAYTDALPFRKYRDRAKIPLSSAKTLFGVKISRLDCVLSADVINLHWINAGMISVREISRLNKLGKTVVWTLRDMWPFTGVCHYAMGCEKYTTGCGRCFQLGSSGRNDLSRRLAVKKRKAFRGIHTVSISGWLYQEVRRSFIFRDGDNFYIPNCIDVNEFEPVDKSAAKKILGLDGRKKNILLGAQCIHDSYKGGEYITPLVKELDKSEYRLLLVGRSGPELPELLDREAVEYRDYGFITDSLALRILFSAADVFLCLSVQEAFGKMPAEAMCCKTPAVSFATSGLKDIVDSQVNGFTAEIGDIGGLLKGVGRICGGADYAEICENARRKIIENFSSEMIAEKYIAFYQDLLGRQKEEKMKTPDKYAHTPPPTRPVRTQRGGGPHTAGRPAARRQT